MSHRTNQVKIGVRGARGPLPERSINFYSQSETYRSRDTKFDSVTYLKQRKKRKVSQIAIKIF